MLYWVSKGWKTIIQYNEATYNKHLAPKSKRGENFTNTSKTSDNIGLSIKPMYFNVDLEAPNGAIS